MAPRASRTRLAVFILALVAGVLGVPSPAHADSTPSTESVVTLVGWQGDWDWITQGQSFRWGPEGAPGLISMSGNASELQVHVDDPENRAGWRMSLAAPPGQQLVVGSYERAQRTPFRQQGHPGLEVSGQSRGCNTVAGRFVVRDIAVADDGSVTRLWATFEQHCDEHNQAAIGELRINEPAEQGISLANSSVEWPETYPTAPGMVVPVTVVNTGSSALHVTAAGVSGADSAQFDIVSNGCTSDVPSGGSCDIQLQFTPASEGPSSAVLDLEDSSPGGTHHVPLAGHGQHGLTDLRFESDEGDFIGRGQSRAFWPGNADIYVTGDASTVMVDVTTDTRQRWSAVFGAPHGHVLEPGTTVSAHRFADDASGRLSVDGESRGCNTVTGTFTIREIVLQPETSLLARFAATFTQHCDEQVPTLRGAISYRSELPLVSPPPTPPPPPPPPPPTMIDTTLTADPALYSLAGDPTVNGRGFTAHLSVTTTGNPLAGLEVSFWVNGKWMCAATTDASGSARCGDAVQMLQAVRWHGFTAVFAGAAWWRPATAHGKAGQLA